MNDKQLPATKTESPIVHDLGVNNIMAYAQNLSDKLEIGKVLIQSGLLPNRYKSPESVVAAIWFGQELGFSPMAAVRNVVVINGTASLLATGLKAKALQHGGQLQTLEWTDTKCTIRATRAGWSNSEEFTFTIEDAKSQGLLGKDNWKRMPKQMLYARCVSTLIRNMWADVVEGVYSTEEMLDSQGYTFDVTETGDVVNVKEARNKPEPTPKKLPEPEPFISADASDPFERTKPIEKSPKTVDPRRYQLECVKSKYKGFTLADIHREEGGFDWLMNVLEDGRKSRHLTESDKSNIEAYLMQTA